jgi:hypothetical protein
VWSWATYSSFYFCGFLLLGFEAFEGCSIIGMIQSVKIPHSIRWQNALSRSSITLKISVAQSLMFGRRMQTLLFVSRLKSNTHRKNASLNAIRRGPSQTLDDCVRSW